MDCGVGWSRLAVGLDIEGVDDGALKHRVYGLFHFLTLGDTLPLRGNLQFLVGIDESALEEETASVIGVVLGFG